ncbi:von Willebrand factor D and EGF domain-containing protein-like [Mytilus trossulus]|uniref:von Willebrand factor D and EGF domain-containing protein-like n=1 Tax=Mytilus trossulus TaxID=6551 RepID=UPI003005884E
MLDEIKSQLCNNNCSQNGICDKGNCVCDDGFIGDDCSLLRTSPPVGLTIPYGGKCGTRSRNCERTLLNGRFESTEVWCKLVYFEVVNNEKQSSLSPMIEKAEYKSFSTVSCPLPTSSDRRRKRSISDKTADGYDISLSNDGTNFGDESTILIYDDECYSCNVTSVSCTLLSSCSLTTVETSGVSSDSVVTTDSTVKTSTANKPTNLLTTTTTTQRHSSPSETTIKTVEPTEDSNGTVFVYCCHFCVISKGLNY